jgi:hypothetical protein
VTSCSLPNHLLFLEDFNMTDAVLDHSVTDTPTPGGGASGGRHMVVVGLYCGDAQHTDLTDAGSAEGEALILAELTKAVEATKPIVANRPGSLIATVSVGDHDQAIDVRDWIGYADLQVQLFAAWQRIARTAAVANAIGDKATVAPHAQKVAEFFRR